jgi:hypothetical protein
MAIIPLDSVSGPFSRTATAHALRGIFIQPMGQPLPALITNEEQPLIIQDSAYRQQMPQKKAGLTYPSSQHDSGTQIWRSK